MTEPVPQPRPPEVTYKPVDLDEELARRNNLFGLALFGLTLLIFAGSFLVALLYLALD